MKRLAMWTLSLLYISLQNYSWLHRIVFGPWVFPVPFPSLIMRWYLHQAFPRHIEFLLLHNWYFLIKNLESRSIDASFISESTLIKCRCIVGDCWFVVALSRLEIRLQSVSWYLDVVALRGGLWLRDLKFGGRAASDTWHCNVSPK